MPLADQTYQVLKSRVLSLCVLSDHNKVDVLVARLNAGDIANRNDVCEQVDSTTNAHVSGGLAMNRCVQRTYEAVRELTRETCVSSLRANANPSIQHGWKTAR